jgi:hypothetical protein
MCLHSVLDGVSVDPSGKKMVFMILKLDFSLFLESVYASDSVLAEIKCSVIRSISHLVLFFILCSLNMPTVTLNKGNKGSDSSLVQQLKNIFLYIYGISLEPNKVIKKRQFYSQRKRLPNFPITSSRYTAYTPQSVLSVLSAKYRVGVYIGLMKLIYCLRCQRR